MNQQYLIRAKHLFFAALGIDIAATIIIGANSFSTIDALKDIEAGIRIADDAFFTHVDSWDKFSSVLFITVIGVGLALVRWLNSCYRFASQVIGATGFKHESWTAAGWIIPILNLFKPYLILNEIYKAGAHNHTGGDDWKKQEGSFLLLSWWIFWAVVHFIGWVIVKQMIRDSFRNDLTLPQIIGLYDIQAWSCVFSIAVAILWFIVAHNLTQRLIDRANIQPASTLSPGLYSNLPVQHTTTAFVTPISAPIAVQSTNLTEPLTSLTNMHHNNQNSQWVESDSIDENRIYEVIARELETGETDKGLWIRLFAECDGDENKAKVLYIKQRAEKLIYTERSRLAEMARAREVEAERLAAQHQQSAKENELLSAVWDGNIAIVNKLLAEGIQPCHLKDEKGRSPLELAKDRGDKQMTRLLDDHAKREAQRANERLMLEYGITFDGAQYNFQDYRYDKLADAIRYAKKQMAQNTL